VNWALRRIFGPETEEATEGWKNVHYEQKGLIYTLLLLLLLGWSNQGE
jgi:hypothetical protein